MAGLPKQNFYMKFFAKAARDFCVAVFFIVMSVVNASAAAGTTGAEFLKVNVGGRASALGGAYTAVTGDVISSQYNPAGLAKMEKRELALMHSEWLVDTRYEFFAFGIPVRNGAVALGVRYFDMGSFVGRDSLGQKTGSFKASDQAVNIAYGARLNDMLSAGVSVMHIKQTIASKSAAGFAADFGLTAEVVRGFLSFGLSAKNLGAKMSAFENEKAELPQSFNAGFVMLQQDGKLMLTGDLIMPKNEDAYAAFALEYDVLGLIDARAGANIGSGRENEMSWTIGMGLNIWDYSLDYCFEPVGELDSAHRVSMTIRF